MQQHTPLIPALWEAKVGGWLEPRSSRPFWAIWQDPISTKNTRSSQVWWRLPVIPATQEAEQDNHLNLGGGVCSEIAHLRFLPGDRVRLRLKKKKERTNIVSTLLCLSSFTEYFLDHPIPFIISFFIAV